MEAKDEVKEVWIECRFRKQNLERLGFGEFSKKIKALSYIVADMFDDVWSLRNFTVQCSTSEMCRISAFILCVFKSNR
jgi:hypothetical protein